MARVSDKPEDIIKAYSESLQGKTIEQIPDKDFIRALNEVRERNFAKNPALRVVGDALAITTETGPEGYMASFKEYRK